MFVIAFALFAPFVAGYVRTSKISMMAGGKSVAEKELTSRQMFRELRNKFNDAAKAPGFFETTANQVVSSDIYFG
jgi:hypothetical protein